MTKTMLKGSPEYSFSKNGVTGCAHCVNVPANLFTLVVNGKWKGTGPEEKIVAALEALEAAA